MMRPYVNLLRSPSTARDSVVMLSAEEYYRLRPEHVNTEERRTVVEEPTVVLLDPIEEVDIPVELVDADEEMQDWMP